MSRGIVPHESGAARTGAGLRGALGYLFRDRDEAVTTAVIGGLCTFLSFLVVPQIVVLGYVVRVLRAVESDERPPRFDRLRALLVDGTKAYAIWLAWMAVPLAVDYGLNTGELAPGQATRWLLGWMFAPGVVSLVADFGIGQSGVVARTGFFEWYRSWEPYVVFLLVLYFLPAALANFAARGTLRAGFFDDGVKRQIDWLLASLRRRVPAAADLLQRVADHFLGAEQFSPVKQLRTREYFVGWLGFFGFYLAAEAVLRLFRYLPSDGGGVLTGLALLYLVVAVPAYFVVRVAGWVVIGRTWATFRRADDPAVGADGPGDDPSDTAGGSSNAAGGPSPVPAGHAGTTDTPSVTTGLPLVGLPARTVLAGGLYLVLGVAAVPSVFVAGYLLRVLRSTVEGSPVPSFGGVRALFADGLRAYAVLFVYGVVPLVVLSVPVLNGLVNGADGWTSLMVWSAIAGVGIPGGFPVVYVGLVAAMGVLVSLFLLLTAIPATVPLIGIVMGIPLGVGVAAFLASQYVVPAALVVVARTGSLRAGLSPARVLPTLRQPVYARNWIGAFLLTVVGWGLFAVMILLPGHPTLGGALNLERIAELDGVMFFAVPTSVDTAVLWLGIPVLSTAYFASLVVASRLIGRAVAAAEAESDVESVSPPESDTDVDVGGSVG